MNRVKRCEPVKGPSVCPGEEERAQRKVKAIECHTESAFKVTNQCKNDYIERPLEARRICAQFVQLSCRLLKFFCFAPRQIYSVSSVVE